MPRIRKIRGQPIDMDLIDLDVTTIRVRTPVVTGNLQNNFSIVDGEIVNPTHYGAFVERGTSKMAPRFMVFRSIPTIARRLVHRVVDQLNRAKLFDLPKRLL